MTEIKEKSGSTEKVLGELSQLHQTYANDLTAIKEKSGSHTEVLGELRELHQSHNEQLSEIKEKSGSQVEILGELSQLHKTHANDLAEIKEKSGSTAEVLGELRGLYQSHNEHLSEIKEKSGSHAEVLGDLRELHQTHANDMTEIKEKSGSTEKVLGELSQLHQTYANDLTAIKEKSGSHTEILGELRGLHQSHNEHLSEIKEKSGSTVEVLRELRVLHQSYIEHLTVIKENSGSHAEVLEELKGLYQAHANVLTEINEKNGSLVEIIQDLREIHKFHSGNVTDKNEQSDSKIKTIEEINDRINVHSNILEEIKENVISQKEIIGQGIGNPVLYNSDSGVIKHHKNPKSMPNEYFTSTNISISQDNSPFEARNPVEKSNFRSIGKVDATESSSSNIKVSQVISLLENVLRTLSVHTNILSEIKDDISAEILTSLHDIGHKSETQNSRLAEIQEADVSDEILTLLHTSHEYNESHSLVLAQTLSRVKEIIRPLQQQNNILPSVEQTKNLTCEFQIVSEEKSLIKTLAPSKESTAFENNVTSALSYNETGDARIQELEEDIFVRSQIKNSFSESVPVELPISKVNIFDGNTLEYTAGLMNQGKIAKECFSIDVSPREINKNTIVEGKISFKSLDDANIEVPIVFDHPKDKKEIGVRNSVMDILMTSEKVRTVTKEDKSSVHPRESGNAKIEGLNEQNVELAPD
ncbi:hypothetical protein GcC1_036037, partial [Golovinomyces cichoracearum]